MPYHCVVPNCKGNYETGPKVNIFSFPKNEELAAKWIRAIKRESYTPTKYSKVCSLHFVPEDIIWEKSCYDKNTGTTSTTKLKMPQLREGAIPSQLPNCPSYLSGPSHRRESPDSKRARKEQSAMQAAIAESVATDILYTNSRLFNSVDELVGKLQFLDTQYWTLIKNNEGLSICRVAQFPYPKIILSLMIKNNCAVQAFVQDTEVNRLGDFKIPVEVHDTNTLEKILDNLSRADSYKRSSKTCNTISVIQLAISFLSILLYEPSFKHSTVLKFVCEQLHLMTLNKMDYSSELVIFSSVFYNCSPQGYRLFRDKKFLILPSYSTIKRVFVSKKFSPATEQDDTNFLMYIKNKYKSLLPSDKVVILMVDEIHLKPYFDYKGGNIVGSAFDSSEAATSAFVFMLNSVRSKFKDVVHIIPTKCMKAQTLHNILKKIIIGLEKIGFTVFCVVTDNNAINGKAMSFLPTHQNYQLCIIILVRVVGLSSLCMIPCIC
ncbi:uncharacterized protein [Macrobrachium rosenbergii]|uniref:uncharacterized protein n=1 Tax=Macrobrachium rosenbergii TaxID=79674 RepID=UPI0034D41C78